MSRGANSSLVAGVKVKAEVFTAPFPPCKALSANTDTW